MSKARQLTIEPMLAKSEFLHVVVSAEPYYTPALDSPQHLFLNKRAFTSDLKG
jgi:hypothetical protein